MRLMIIPAVLTLAVLSGCDNAATTPVAEAAELEEGSASVVETPLADEAAQSAFAPVQITNARVVGESFKPGDKVTIAYELVNTSERTIIVPENTKYSRPMNLIGTRQHFILRNGDEPTIPAIPVRIARKGARYAAGGSIIPSEPELPPGFSQSFTQTVATTDYPVGSYSYFIQYKRDDGTVDEVEVAFELSE